MSEDVRKNLRTQGRYSDKGLHFDDKSHNRDKRQKVCPPSKGSPEKKVHKRNSDGSKGVSVPFLDESISPPKYEENADYTFSQLDDIKKPIEITGRGEQVLSKTENGESKILFEPQFFDQTEAWDYFDRIYSATNWHSKNILIQGVEYPQPRLVAWYGPFPYTYSGATLEAAEMPDTVLEIKEQIEKYLASKNMNVTFNSVLLNLYRDGKDSVAWHSDDELTMGISPTIASVSLGETRKFQMRPKVKHFEEESAPEIGNDEYVVRLTHGSLIIMTGCMQDDWQHRVPKEYHDKEARINLTFRTVYPFEKVPEHGPAKEIKKEPTANYSSNKTSSSGINLDVDNLENFPPLTSHNVKPNISEKNQFPYSNLTKDDFCISSTNLDNEASADEQNSVTGNDSYGISSATKGNKYNDCIIENNKSLDSVGSHVNVPENSLNINQENNLDKKESQKKWDYIKADISVNDNQENNFKSDNTETCSVVNGTWEKNKNKKDYQAKYHNIENNSSPNDNHNFKKDPSKKFRNTEADLSTNVSREKNMDRKERPMKCRNTETNSSVNSHKSNFVKKDSPKKFRNGESNSTVNNIRKNMDRKEYSSRYIEAKSDLNVNQENVNMEKPPNACHYEANSSANVTQENNLDKKVPHVKGLNVEAKEFVPTNISSVPTTISSVPTDISSYNENIYSPFELEDLIHYEINLMQGDQLKYHACTLKNKILDRISIFTRFDRDELDFLCKLTDGTQTDKNQKLISTRMCNIVINAFERNQSFPAPRRSFDGNSRHRGYGNQSHHSERGRVFQNQNRNNNYRY